METKMKYLRRRQRCATLLLALAVITFSVAISPAQGDKRFLTENEMAEIKGSYLACAQCIDGCTQSGSSSSCTGACSYSNYCHAKYQTASNISVTILRCSMDPNAGQRNCATVGEEKTCYNVKTCECRWDGSEQEMRCSVYDYGTVTEKDNCS
jgi:carboxypeptidase C (cathepsin A)